MPRQFVAVQLGGKGRAYTYHNDGEPVAMGDDVVVETRNGRMTSKVVGLPEEEPPFATKAIIGKAPDKPKSKIDPDEMLGAMMGGVSRNG